MTLITTSRIIGAITTIGSCAVSLGWSSHKPPSSDKNLIDQNNQTNSQKSQSSQSLFRPYGGR